LATSEPEGRKSTLPEDAATTQSLFREVNERVKEVGEQMASFTYPADAICECAQAECSDSISICKDGYERLRRHRPRLRTRSGPSVGTIARKPSHLTS